MKLKKDNVIFHVRVGAEPLKMASLKLGTFVELMDLINHTNFYLFLVNSFRASGGSKMRIYL
jgi:hypothetical protein